MTRIDKLNKLYSIKQDIDQLKQLISYQLDQQTEYRFDLPFGPSKVKVKTKF